MNLPRSFPRLPNCCPAWLTSWPTTSKYSGANVVRNEKYGYEGMRKLLRDLMGRAGLTGFTGPNRVANCQANQTSPNPFVSIHEIDPRKTQRRSTETGLVVKISGIRQTKLAQLESGERKSILAGAELLSLASRY